MEKDEKNMREKKKISAVEHNTRDVSLCGFSCFQQLYKCAFKNTNQNKTKITLVVWILAVIHQRKLKLHLHEVWEHQWESLGAPFPFYCIGVDRLPCVFVCEQDLQGEAPDDLKQ